jgi:hypothetical protein
MKRKEREEYIKELELIKNGEYRLIGDYINNGIETTYLHLECNKKFDETPKRFQKYKYPCPYCRQIKKHKNTIKKPEEFIKEVRKLCEDEYSVVGEYNGNKEKISMRHNCRACENNVFDVTPNNFLRGHGCPKCNPSGTSFPELCLLYAIQDVIPLAQKKKINNRECDIYFQLNGIEICIQYDGVFYHRNVRKDESFNQSFLKKPNHMLFRVREEKCCELQKMKFLYIEKTSQKYSKISLQRNINNIFKKINKVCNTDFHPVLSEEMITRAKKDTGWIYFYKKLAKEYEEFIMGKGCAPKGSEENDLRGRVTRALRDNKFTDEDRENIIGLRKQVGDIRERREADEIFRDLCIFYDKKKFLPRQQEKGDELELYREVKYCFNNNLFSQSQQDIYQVMYSESENYIETEKELFVKLERFIECNDRFPNSNSSDKEEKSLISKINHRINRKSCSEEFIEKVDKYKAYYEVHQITRRKYIQFELKNNRLPSSNNESCEEKSLAVSMRRYLRQVIYTREEIEEILSIRSKHLTLKEIINDAVRYLGVDEYAYVFKLYIEFISQKGRPPKLNKQDKYEDDLFHIVRKYANKGRFSAQQSNKIISDYEMEQIKDDEVERVVKEYLEYFKKNNKSPKRNSKLYKDTKRIIDKYKYNQYVDVKEVVKIFNELKCDWSAKKTYDEAIHFYETNGRMPRHIKGNDDKSIIEKRLAARISQLRYKGFTEKQKLDIESKLFLNKARPHCQFCFIV